MIQSSVVVRSQGERKLFHDAMTECHRNIAKGKYVGVDITIGRF